MQETLTCKELKQLLETFPENAKVQIRRDTVERDSDGKWRETKIAYFDLIDAEIDFEEDENRVVIIGPATQAS